MNSVQKIACEIAGSDNRRIACPNPRDICEEILTSNAPIYRHPLGFVHAEITESIDIPRPFDRARLHFFKPCYSKNATSPSVAHSHEWRLRSYLLLGEIEDVNYIFTPSFKGLFTSATIKYHSKSNAEIELGSSGDLVRTRSNSYAQGDVYNLEPETLHSTVIVKPTITFVLSQKTDMRATAIFNKGSKFDLVNIREQLTKEERVRLIPDYFDD